MKALVVVLALTATGCAATLRHAADASEVLGHVSLACDGFSTRAGVTAGLREENMFLGERPSGTMLVQYFGAVSAVDFATNRVVAASLRHHVNVAAVVRLAMNLTLAGFETHAVLGNTAHGVSLCGL